MKHIKSLLLLAPTLALIFLYQCKNEQIEAAKDLPVKIPKVTAYDEVPFGTIEVLDKYLASSDFHEFLTKYNFEPLSYHRAETDLKAEFFVVRIKHTGNTLNLKDYYLMIFLVKNKYETLVYEEEYVGDVAKLSVFDTERYTYLVGRDILLSPNETEQVLDRSCYTESSGFGECYFCGWSELMSDSSSAALCLVMLVACDAAVVAHCLGWTS